MWRTFFSLYRTDLVIDTSRLATMRVTVPAGSGQDAGTAREFVARLNERLTASGRLSSATMANAQIIGSPGSTRELVIAGRPQEPAGKAPTTQYLSTGDRFFETTRIPIVRGRSLGAADGTRDAKAPSSTSDLPLCSSQNENPIGRRIQLIDPRAKVPQYPWLTIVGVSRTSTEPLLNQPEQPVVYQPLGADPLPQPSMTVVVADMPLQAAASALREEVRALRPGLAVYAIEPLDAAVARGRMAQKLSARARHSGRIGLLLAP